jgi:hypothetical protein
LPAVGLLPALELLPAAELLPAEAAVVGELCFAECCFVFWMKNDFSFSSSQFLKLTLSYKQTFP